MKHLLVVVVIILLAHVPGMGQDVSQTVKGKVVNGLTEKVLTGASVTLTNPGFNQGASTDAEGNFVIPGVPPGRYRIQVSFTGYRAFDDELLVISGKESQLSIHLEESPTMLGEVQVSSSAHPEYEAGLQTLPIEKTMRMPANFFDPVRMATSYPNIVAANDQANAIIVKGNSPNGLLWRLNGLDIVNPNHLANAGTFSDRPVSNGGGVNILSAQMLQHTDLYTGAFPARFGNALSAILDMNLREGNREQHEYTAQASLIGLDVAAEGPIGKNRRSSFLANYRYSTVGLLSKLGVEFGDEEIFFQDLSLNLNLYQKDGGRFMLFGLFGDSENDFEAKDPGDFEEDKDKYDILYESDTYAFGGTYNRPLGNGNLSIGVAYSAFEQDRSALASQNVDFYERRLIVDEYQAERSLLSGHLRYELKTGKRSSLEAGAMINYQDDLTDSYKRFGCLACSSASEQSLDGTGDGVLLQPYANWNTSFTEQLSMKLGIRYLHYTFNETNSLEPRVALDYEVTPASSVNLSYGLVSQLQLPVTYFAEGNDDLGFTKAHHVSAGYRRQLTEGLKLRTELFYQKLFDVPIENNSASTFSALNLLEGFAPSGLVNEGTGENYGINAVVEKSFFYRHYVLTGVSYYESKYAAGDLKTRDTRFNGNYTVNVVYGKEWTKEEKGRTIGLNTRLLYLGGLRESKVSVTASESALETVYDTSDPFSEKLEDYFRIDLRLSFRKNKPGYTRTFAIDIQNLSGRENEAYSYYDLTQQKVVMKRQLGLIPVLVYRIDF